MAFAEWKTHVIKESVELMKPEIKKIEVVMEPIPSCCHECPAKVDSLFSNVDPYCKFTQRPIKKWNEYLNDCPIVRMNIEYNSEIELLSTLLNVVEKSMAAVKLRHINIAQTNLLRECRSVLQELVDDVNEHVETEDVLDAFTTQEAILLLNKLNNV